MDSRNKNYERLQWFQTIIMDLEKAASPNFCYYNGIILTFSYVCNLLYDNIIDKLIIMNMW